MDYVISSSIGTLCAEIITLPLCTVKTNKILCNDKSVSWHFKNIYTHRGISGFYNASIPAVLSQVISTTSKFSFYRIIQRERKTEKSDIINNMFNGASSGLVGGIMSHPFDVVRVMKQNCNIQNQNQKHFEDKFKIKYVYRGYSMSALKSILLGAMIFPFYDFLNTKFNNMYIASIIAGLGTSCILYPIECMKIKKMATGNKYGLGKLNLQNYYSGFCLHNARCVPHFLIFSIVTEKLKQNLFI